MVKISGREGNERGEVWRLREGPLIFTTALIQFPSFSFSTKISEERREIFILRRIKLRKILMPLSFLNLINDTHLLLKNVDY